MNISQRFFTRPNIRGLRWGLLGRLTLVVAQLLGLAGFTLADWQPARAAPVCTPIGDYMVCTFNYTGAPENWTAPAGVTEATFDLYGASGSENDIGIGRGGRVMATLAVTPGATYQIRVGGTKGYNGGGMGALNYGDISRPLWGGGASDLRTGAFALTDRLLVAGGGGAAGRTLTIAGNLNAAIPGATGGDGGYPNGGTGVLIKDPPGLYSGGNGGTQSASGNGGIYGSLGQGGSVTNQLMNGGGGGGGYYGGDASLTGSNGGGGGSSYGPADALFQNGVLYGNGVVIITYRVKTTAVEPVCSATPTQTTCTVSLAYSGVPQLWRVPPGVTQATFDLYGAEGVEPYYFRNIIAGKGGRALATLTVTPGTTYQLLVGGQNGFNGGGAGGHGFSGDGGNGGGATDLRQRPFGLADRLLVAGGGGGAGAGQAPNSLSQGYDAYKWGGLAEGGNSSIDGKSSPDARGGRAGMTYGGAGGSSVSTSIYYSTPGRSGSLGLGGTGGDFVGLRSPDKAGLGGGGGGGGYYGGGGGAAGILYWAPVSTFPPPDAPGDYGFSAGGGGGSNYGPATTEFEDGVRKGNGMVVITYTIQGPPLPTNGTVSVWGNNALGQLNIPAGLSGVVKIAAGFRHTLALKNDGTVVAWGDNAYGQSTPPVGLSGVTAIAAGARHSLALKGDGTVVAWGENSIGQLNIPAGLTNVTAIAAGDFHNLALKNDGTVVAWGSNNAAESTVPAGLNNVTAIGAGWGFSVALKGDGTVVAWGDNTYKQLTVPTGLSGVIRIAAGRLHTLALKSNNTVVAWGYTCCNQTRVPAGLTDVVALAGGGYHSLALKSDGTVVSWGDNTQGQRNLPAGLSGVAAISAGQLHTVLLSQDGGFQGGGVAAAANSAMDTAALTATVPLSLVQVLEEPPGVLPPFDMTTTEVATAVDTAPAVAETTGQSQRLFLPLVANLGTMAASDSAAAIATGASVGEATTQSAAVNPSAATTLTLTAVDPNAVTAAQPVTTTAPAAVITTSAPVSTPVPVAAAPIVTESAPVVAPVAVESAAVVTESVPVSAPAVVEAVPAVTDTLVLTTTQPITPDAAAVANPLAGTAVGSGGGIVVLLLVGLAVAGSLVWQRRRSRTDR